MLAFRVFAVCALAFAVPVRSQPAPPPSISAAQGTLVRWSAAGTLRCAMKGRGWAALNGTCYYPIDIEQPPGAVIAISRSGGGQTHYGRITVDAMDYGTEEITLPDIPQAHPSAADLQRDERDRAKLARIFTAKESPAKFHLPIGPAALPLAPGKSFGVKRVFNGKPSSQPHMGIDFATPVGSPVLAVADGTVVLAEDLFFEGNAVFVDHGDGLISMSFHLSDIDVKVGQPVKKGHTLGHVGSTGRATGPHLYFGIRWHDARINPKFLLEEPGNIPAVVEKVTPAAKNKQ